MRPRIRFVNDEMQGNICIKDLLEDQIVFCFCSDCSLNRESTSQLYECRFKAIVNNCHRTEDNLYTAVFEIQKSNVIRPYNHRIASAALVNDRLMIRVGLNEPQFTMDNVRPPKVPGMSLSYVETSQWINR